MKYKFTKREEMILKFTCWFSKKFYDVHSYEKHKWWTWTPMHFVTYKCHNCWKSFEI